MPPPSTLLKDESKVVDYIINVNFDNYASIYIQPPVEKEELVNAVYVFKNFEFCIIILLIPCVLI